MDNKNCVIDGYYTMNHYLFCILPQTLAHQNKELILSDGQSNIITIKIVFFKVPNITLNAKHNLKKGNCEFYNLNYVYTICTDYKGCTTMHRPRHAEISWNTLTNDFNTNLKHSMILSITMLCFFLSVYTITCRNNASNFNFSSYSGSKMNLVGGWCIGEVIFLVPNRFQKHREKPKKKIKEKREFLRKTSYRPNRFFYMVVIQKLIALNFQNILTFFDVDKKILDDHIISNFYESSKICNSYELKT
ncbi:Uncharacterized protein FWK35_00022150 [Aphis craccivora]|uniref:Uncharacterized protein n=1 Tax=Aphis craccivora TaxID=307492 RepID=A0A6G0W030_APHCR|nr:Uncharacterized protein FWK35_00022150 [Aphis craccivora]